MALSTPIYEDIPLTLQRRFYFKQGSYMLKSKNDLKEFKLVLLICIEAWDVFQSNLWIFQPKWSIPQEMPAPCQGQLREVFLNFLIMVVWVVVVMIILMFS